MEFRKRLVFKKKFFKVQNNEYNNQDHLENNKTIYSLYQF